MFVVVCSALVTIPVTLFMTGCPRGRSPGGGVLHKVWNCSDPEECNHQGRIHHIEPYEPANQAPAIILRGRQVRPWYDEKRWGSRVGCNTHNIACHGLVVVLGFVICNKLPEEVAATFYEPSDFCVLFWIARTLLSYHPKFCHRA